MQRLYSAAAFAPMFAAILFPATQASRSAQEASGIDVVETAEDPHDRLTVPVRIGEHGPYQFLLDTGAQNTVLSATLASELDLPASADATLVGVAGQQRVATVEVDEILLGKRSYYGLLAPLLERRHIGADGILGIDSLQDQRVLIDFRRNLIAIDDARALGGNRGFEIVVKARRRSGQLIMADATIDGVRTDVVIDTGAEASIGNRALQAALARRRMEQEGTVISSVTGQTLPAEVGLARKLEIGKLTIGNIAIAFADAPAFDVLDLDRRPALLLGMRELKAFRRVAIDFSTRKVLFDLPAQ